MIGNPRAGVHQNHICHLIQFPETVKQIRDLFIGQIAQSGNSGSPRDKPDSHRTFRYDLRDLFSMIYHICQIVLGNGAKHYFDIGKAKIRIKNKHPFSHLLHLHRKVHSHIRLSNATFSTCDGNDSGIRLIILFF